MKSGWGPAGRRELFLVKLGARVYRFPVSPALGERLDDDDQLREAWETGCELMALSTEEARQGLIEDLGMFRYNG